MGRVFFLAIFFFLQLNAIGQAFLSGSVKSASSGEILPGVTIIVDDTAGVITDTSGYYTINLSPSKHVLVFRMIGFAEYKTEIILDGKEKETLNIVLKETAKELGVVVVTAGRHEQKLEDVTVSMEVIRPSLVENTNTTNLETLIDQVPGVNVTDGQANIRGGAGWSYGAGSRVLVLVDDIPELSADASDAKWNFIPSENLEQIEVIKGASSVLFGSSALNGVINFRTAYPRDTPQTRITAYGGFYDRPVLKLGGQSHNLKWWGSSLQSISGGSFLHSQKIGRLDFVAGGNMLLDNGYREGEFENRYRMNVNLRYRSRLEGLSYGVNANVQVAEGYLFFVWKNDTTGAYIPADNSLQRYTNWKHNIDPFVTYIGKRGSSHRLRTRYFNNYNTNNTNQNSTSEVFYGEYQYQKHFADEKYTLTAGVTDQYSKVESQLYSNHSGYNTAAYVQGDAKINRFNFSAGGRVEQNKIDSRSEDPEVVFRAGVNYHVFSETYLRASAGQGYRFPSVAERYINTIVAGQLGIYPNDSLQAEKGFSAEIGVKQGIKIGNWRGYADVAVFLNRYNNMIEFAFAQWGIFSDPFIGFGFRSINVGNTEIRGAEFTLTGSGKFAGMVMLELLAGYTYIDPKQTSYSDYYLKKTGDSYLGSDSSNFLKYRFKHLARIDMQFLLKRVSWGLSMRYNSHMVNIDRVFVNELGEMIIPGVGHYRTYRKNGDFTMDARLGYAITPMIKTSFICKNLFNYIYMTRPADMQPPRTFVLQLTVAI